MEIYRLGPESLDVSLVRDLFSRAFLKSTLVTIGSFEEQEVRYRAMLGEPRNVFLLGVDEEAQLCLSFLFAPPAEEGLFPQLVQFHNEGGTKLRAAMVDASVAVARALGHTCILAVNVTGHPPSVWARLFRRAGPAEKVGDIMRVQFASSLQEGAKDLQEGGKEAISLEEEEPRLEDKESE